MRLVYIASSVIPSRTANSIHVMKMCQAFADNGHEVTLVVPEYGSSRAGRRDQIFDYYGVRRSFQLVRLRWAKFVGSGHWFGFRASLLAKRMHADIVYGRHISGCFFSSMLGMPTVYESHQPISDAGRYSALMFRLMTKFRSLLGLVLITDALRSFYADRYGTARTKMVVAPDGADPIDPFRPTLMPRARSTTPRIGYIGHLYRGRGIELIEKTARLLPQMDFHIIGGEPSDVDRWKDITRELRNFYVHGYVLPRDIDTYKRSFDILLAPYQHRVEIGNGGNTVKWMSPLKVFEYMAAGRAIVASDLAAIREVLRDGENALLVPPDDVSEWVAAIVRLTSSSDLREKIARRAHEEFVEKYTWKARANRVLSSIQARPRM